MKKETHRWDMYTSKA